jgi:serine/threonine-protein kinase
VTNTVDMNVGAARSQDLVGQLVDGRYRVEARLGAGGMGTVYRAEHTDIRKPVALKVLLPELVDTPDMFKRFRQEAKAASSIGHANIVEISDFGTLADGSPFFVMEYLRGDDLATILKRDGPLPWRRAFELTLQIASALHAAHEAGIVHRDVKPDNFFVVQRDGQDFVKVLDFGIAKLLGDEHSVVTRTGLFVGTPEYMSPEQAEGLELDRRVDVYGTGIMLYQLLTGRVPFKGKDEFDVLNQHVNVPPEPLARVLPRGEFPAEVEAVVFKALSKKRDGRQQSMEQLGQELRAALERPPAPAPEPEPEPEPARRPATQARSILLGIALGVAIVAVAVGIFLLVR